MKKSFHDWCIENNRKDILDRWDYKLNAIDPHEISIYSKEYFYLKCQSGIHKSSQYQIATLRKHNSPLECRYCNSFQFWCENNDRQDLLDRWDYDLNIISPEEVSQRSLKKLYFKCPRELHESTPYKPVNLTAYSYSAAKCVGCNSFAQLGIDNVCKDFLEKYWDYELNSDIDPWTLPAAARKDVDIYIKCQNVDYHGSYKTLPQWFKRGYRCPYCAHSEVHPKESFAQWGIDNIGVDFLEKYWDKRNEDNPFELAYKSNKKVLIKCQEKDYHGSYSVVVCDFTTGTRCPYCHMIKVHKLDSLGVKNPESLLVWSDLNEDTPYDIAPKSSQKRWFKCENAVHKDYFSTICRANSRAFKCPKCHQEDVDSYLQQKVDEYIQAKYNYQYLKEYDCSPKCINPDTGYILPYDRELIIQDVHLLIEVQGVQHYKICLHTRSDALERNISVEEAFELQQFRDKLKSDYALNNGYEFLEIPYYTSDNDEYKNLIDEKISYIISQQLKTITT